MTEDATRSPTKSDPDIWTVINLVVCSVSMFAQLASLKIEASSQSKLPVEATSAYENLRDALDEGLRDVQKLIRLLGYAENSSVLNEPFQFGENHALFTSARFSQYQQLVQKIALDAGNISSWTLTVVSVHPDVARTLGERIANRLGRINERINRIYRSNPSNEAVLEDCLTMYRVFSEIMAEIERFRN